MPRCSQVTSPKLTTTKTECRGHQRRAETGAYDSSCAEATAFQVLHFQAVKWEPNGEIHELAPDKGDTVGFVFGINDRGQAVGTLGTCLTVGLHRCSLTVSTQCSGSQMVRPGISEPWETRTLPWSISRPALMNWARLSGSLRFRSYGRELDACAISARFLEPRHHSRMLQYIIQMGRIKEQIDFDWAGAKASYKRAVELEPGNPESVLIAALSAVYLGRVDEASIEPPSR